MRFKKLTTTATTPTRGTPGSAGLDLYSDQDALVSSWASVTVGTGIAVEIPEGYVGLLFLRSSIGKAGVALANGVGVIDSDYRGELKLQLIYSANVGGYHITRGDRIAQLVVLPAPTFDLVEVDELPDTQRGGGGFGSTGR
jgi:dUTP pyrophosphatase